VHGVFVTGTGTGVGKTVVAGAICAALAARGDRVAAFKPALTGLDEPPGPFPRDHELLAFAAGSGQAPEAVSPWRYGPALSPHLAARLAGQRIDVEALPSAAQRAAVQAGADVLVCEGVGGLLVPLAQRYLVRDLAVALGLPVVIATRPGLGTINHTLLTIEAARTAGLDVAGVVMTPWPERPEPIAVSNRETVAELAGVAVSVLAPTRPAALAAAGAALPLDEWLVRRPPPSTL